MIIHLCQGCLAIARLPQYEAEALCTCGEDLYGCSSCAWKARALLAGVRDPYVLDLQRPEEGHLPFWCEATGTRREARS